MSGFWRRAWLALGVLALLAAQTLGQVHGVAHAPAVHHGPVEDVSRLSVGAIRDWRINEHAVFGVGALVQQHFASDALEPLYDGDPQGAMGFVRLKIG